MTLDKDRFPIAIKPSEKMGNMIHISWMLHNQCNKRCSYCREFNWNGDSGWLKYDQIITFVDKVINHSQKDLYHFSFTGGEPVLWPQFDQLCHYLKNKGCEIGLTTNGSKSISYWENISDTLNWTCISFHPESSNEDHIFNVVKVLANKSRVSVRLMMHKEKEFWDKSVAFGEKLKMADDCSFIFVEYVPLQNDFGLHSRPMVYENWQREFLEKENHFTVLPTKDVINTHRRDVWDYTTYFNDGTSEFCRPNDLVANNQVNFKNWICHIGLDLLFINHRGEILKGACKQGGNIGHIFDPNLKLPTKPQTCGVNFCPCATDILIKKHRPGYFDEF